GGGGSHFRTPRFWFLAQPLIAYYAGIPFHLQVAPILGCHKLLRLKKRLKISALSRFGRNTKILVHRHAMDFTGLAYTLPQRPIPAKPYPAPPFNAHLKRPWLRFGGPCGTTVAFCAKNRTSGLLRSRWFPVK